MSDYQAYGAEVQFFFSDVEKKYDNSLTQHCYYTAELVYDLVEPYSNFPKGESIDLEVNTKSKWDKSGLERQTPFGVELKHPNKSYLGTAKAYYLVHKNDVSKLSILFSLYYRKTLLATFKSKEVYPKNLATKHTLSHVLKAKQLMTEIDQGKRNEYILKVKPKNYKVYYADLNEKFAKHYSHILKAEGVGVANGWARYSGRILVAKNKVFVSVMANSPAQNIGEVFFKATAEIFINGALKSSYAVNDRSGAWPNTGEVIVGSTSFALPVPEIGDKISLELKCTYTYRDSSGSWVYPLVGTIYCRIKQDLKFEVILE